MNRTFHGYSEKISVSDLSNLGVPDIECQVIGELISDMGDDDAVEAVYLYGSYARSEQKPYSDIDIAVITASSSPTRKEREYIGSYSSKRCDIQVFSDLPLPAQIRVFSEGIPLLIKNPVFLRDLVRTITLTYMDYEPVRDRFKRRMRAMTVL
jgi:predicted nucleotidyltransferase